MKSDFIIRRETSADYRTVETLTREAFWNIYRPGCTEHYVLHCFRDNKDFIPELDFVMEKNGKIIGHIMYAHSAIETTNGKTVPIMTFGPISIAPDYEGQGYGTALLQYSMNKAKEMGCGALAMTGNIGFYGKSGFEVAKTRGVFYKDDPDADYFLIKELIPHFLDNIRGTYKDPAAYFVSDAAAEEFDKQFPPKKKQAPKYNISHNTVSEN